MYKRQVLDDVYRTPRLRRLLHAHDLQQQWSTWISTRTVDRLPTADELRRAAGVTFRRALDGGELLYEGLTSTTTFIDIYDVAHDWLRLDQRDQWASLDLIYCGHNRILGGKYRERPPPWDVNEFLPTDGRTCKLLVQGTILQTVVSPVVERTFL